MKPCGISIASQGAMPLILRRKILARSLAHSRILSIRGARVIVDTDLAAVYGVTTKAFNQAVRRNATRFPPDFRFQLTQRERDEVVTNCDHLRSLRFSPVRPWAFTEHGAIMAASVLNSSRAVEMSVFVVRAFLHLRELVGTHAKLAAKIDALQHQVAGHDVELERVFAALRALIEPSRKPRRPIGFGRKVAR
jgi:hypothetical protein